MAGIHYVPHADGMVTRPPRRSIAAQPFRVIATSVLLMTGLILGLPDPAANAWVAPLTFVVPFSPTTPEGRVIGVKVNSTTGKIFVLTDNESVPSTLDIIDPTIGARSTVNVGLYANAFDINEVTNKIYIVNGRSNSSPPSTGAAMTIVDATTNAVQTVNLSPGLATAAYSVLVDSLANKVYLGIAYPNLSQLAVFDGVTGAVNSFTGEPVGRTMALDSTTNRLYVLANLEGRVFDTVSRTLIGSFSLPNWVTSSAIDVPGRRLYVSGNGVPFANGYAGIVDLNTLQTRLTPVLPASALNIVVDPNTHKAAMTVGSKIVIVDPTTATYSSQIDLPSVINSLQIDPSTRRIFVGSRSISSSPYGDPFRTVSVIDADTTTIVRTESLPSITSTTRFSQLAFVALNRNTHQVFAAVSMPIGTNGYVTSLDPGPSDPSGVALSGELNAATVSWTNPTWPGTAGSFVPTTVRLRSSVTNAILATADVASNATTNTFTNITRGSYRAEVQLRNSASFVSSAVTSPVANVFSTPGQPGSAALTVIGPGRATATWAAPLDDGGSPIVGYDIIAERSDGLPSSGFTASGTTTTLTGLGAGVYRIRVSARNSYSGYGVSSDPSAPTTITGIAGPPTSITATALDASVSVSWAPPTRTGGTPISGYRITLMPATSTQSAAAFDVASTATSATVSAPTAGTYRIEVAALNPQPGVSGFAARTVVTTRGFAATGLQIVGAAPLNIVATTSNSGLDLAWGAAPPPGQTITGFRVTVTPTTGEVQLFSVPLSITSTPPLLGSFPPGTNNAYSLSGLPAGTKSVSIASVGNSALGASSAPKAVTLVGRPGAPTIPVVTAAGTTVTVSFGPPADLGGSTAAGILYDLLVTAPGPGPGAIYVQRDVSSPTTFDVRFPGSYRFVVRARTPAGIGPTSTPSATVTIP